MSTLISHSTIDSFYQLRAGTAQRDAALGLIPSVIFERDGKTVCLIPATAAAAHWGSP